MTIQRLFSVTIILLTLVACQSKPKLIDDGSDTGVWEGRVRIMDTKKNKKTWGYVKWQSESLKNRLRVDVQAVFGIPVATFILVDGQADLWLHQESKHFTSKDPEKLFSNLVRIPLDPQIFFALLNKKPQLRKVWSCARAQKQTQCDNIKSGIYLTLMNQTENERKIEIKKGPKQLLMALSRSKVQVLDKSFRFKKFPNYKQISM